MLRSSYFDVIQLIINFVILAFSRHQHKSWPLLVENTKMIPYASRNPGEGGPWSAKIVPLEGPLGVKSCPATLSNLWQSYHARGQNVVKQYPFPEFLQTKLCPTLEVFQKIYRKMWKCCHPSDPNHISGVQMTYHDVPGSKRNMDSVMEPLFTKRWPVLDLKPWKRYCVQWLPSHVSQSCLKSIPFPFKTASLRNMLSVHVTSPDLLPRNNVPCGRN